VVELRAAREEFEGLGFDTLPLAPGTKNRPIVRAWQRQEPYRMWQIAPENANIALRSGGCAQAAFIDCDDKDNPATFTNIESYLAGLGYLLGDYPVIQTASGIGRHIYIAFEGGLPGNARNLSLEFGAGEFRYGPGAYVVAPPSIVGIARYALLEGDYRQLPRLSLAVILPILGNQDTVQERGPVGIPRRAKALLQGINLEKYRTRSEAEQAILVSLINAGFSFEEILQLFIFHPCAGKFSELRGKSEKKAMRWLRFSFEKAKEWAETHESERRQIAKSVRDWAEKRAWPGRTGSTDRAVFLAHTQIAYRAGRLTYAASARDLAELAGVSHPTASNATRRLCSDSYRLLALDIEAVADCAAIYRLENPGQSLPLPHSTEVRECKVMSSHDAFRFRGLGKSAAEVWEVLQHEPATERELAERTGRHKRTVVRALKRMSKLIDGATGEVVSMVENEGNTWRTLEVDLDFIASLIGTAGTGKQQRKKHKQERQCHRRALARGRNEKHA